VFADPATVIEPDDARAFEQDRPPAKSGQVTAESPMQKAGGAAAGACQHLEAHVGNGLEHRRKHCAHGRHTGDVMKRIGEAHLRRDVLVELVQPRQSQAFEVARILRQRVRIGHCWAIRPTILKYRA